VKETGYQEAWRYGVTPERNTARWAADHLARSEQSYELMKKALQQDAAEPNCSGDGYSFAMGEPASFRTQRI